MVWFGKVIRNDSPHGISIVPLFSGDLAHAFLLQKIGTSDLFLLVFIEHGHGSQTRLLLLGTKTTAWVFAERIGEQGESFCPPSQDTITTCNNFQGCSGGFCPYSMFLSFIFTASWAALHLWLIALDISTQEVESLPLSLRGIRTFNQYSILIVNVGFQFACQDQLVNPGFGTSQPLCRPFRIQDLSF
jgi:hypothetical protein